MTPALITSRLILRPLRAEDAPRIQELFPHFELVQYLADVIPWPYPDDGAETFLAGKLPLLETGNQYAWAITDGVVGDDRLMGLIELMPDSAENHRGFWLGLPYHRQGYMTEAAAVVQDFAFETLGMPELRLENAEPNRASHRLKEKAGATIMQIKDDAPFVGGRFPEVRWRLTAEQWRANRLRFLS